MRCPRCGENLSAATATWSLFCASGHSFDANKRGYLTLVDRSRGILGDSREILEARRDFLTPGHYSPIVDVLDAVLPDDDALSLLDSGTGTGYYLGALLERRSGWNALALDVSVDAVSMAVRSTGAFGLVADVWQPLAVRDDRAHVVLCVFAPRNPAEFARVLAPGGRLVVVTPAPGHLAELREEGAIIGIQPDKLEHLDAALHPLFRLRERRGLGYTLRLTPDEIARLAGMGPSGHHDRPGAAHDPHAGAGRPITVAVDVSVFTPR